MKITAKKMTTKRTTKIRLSASRLGRTTLLIAILAVGTPLALTGCSGSTSPQSAPTTSQVNSGDLLGVDVDVHQAVG